MRDILIKIVNKLFEYSIILSVFCMVVILAVNVFLRYVLNHPLSWAEEISVLMMVWLVFLGAGIVQKSGGHISIEYIFDLFPIKWKHIVLIFGNICVFLVLVVHLFSGFNLLKLQMKTTMVSVDISMVFFALAVLVGIVGMMCFTADSIIKGLKNQNP